MKNDNSIETYLLGDIIRQRLTSTPQDIIKTRTMNERLRYCVISRQGMFSKEPDAILCLEGVTEKTFHIHTGSCGEKQIQALWQEYYRICVCIIVLHNVMLPFLIIAI